MQTFKVVTQSGIELVKADSFDRRDNDIVFKVEDKAVAFVYLPIFVGNTENLD